MRLKRPWMSVLVAGCLAVGAPAAWADDLVMHPGAHGPELVGAAPGAAGAVRLLDAHLDIRFGRSLTTLTTRFVFRSAGKAKHQLGFPDLAAAQEEAGRRDPDGRSRFPTADVTGAMPGAQTLVNDWPAETKRQFGYVVPDPDGRGWKPGTAENGRLMAWHVTTVEFPAGKDVTVERRYQVRNGRHPAGVTFFEYLVHTAAGWQGPIGRWVVDVILADGLTVDDLIWQGRPLPRGLTAYPAGFHTRPGRGEWRVTSPTHMRLDWRDFEPVLGGDRSGLVLAAPTGPGEPPPRR